MNFKELNFSRTDLMTIVSAVAVVALAIAGTIGGEAAVAFIVGSVMKSPVAK